MGFRVEVPSSKPARNHISTRLLVHLSPFRAGANSKPKTPVPHTVCSIYLRTPTYTRYPVPWTIWPRLEPPCSKAHVVAQQPGVECGEWNQDTSHGLGLNPCRVQDGSTYKDSISVRAFEDSGLKYSGGTADRVLTCA